MGNVIKVEFGEKIERPKQQFDPHELGKIMLYYQENPPVKLRVVKNESTSDAA